MAELNAFLNGKGVTKEQLYKPIKLEHRNEIAVKIAEDWESLATFIGVPPQDVYDLKETYPNTPRDQRLGMMEKWEKLCGSEATYSKLIKGLEQTGRRDLTELLVNELEPSKKSLKAHEDRGLPKRVSRGKPKIN